MYALLNFIRDNLLPYQRYAISEKILKKGSKILTSYFRKAADCLRDMRQQLRKRKIRSAEHNQAVQKCLDKVKRKQIRIMKRLVQEILKSAFYDAYFNPKHVIMSDRARKLSNLIIKDICQLLKLKIPDRKKEGTFI